MSSPRSRSLFLSALGLAACLHSAPAAAQSEPFLGQIMCGGWNFAPRGWVKLDGALLPISDYSALFALLGTTYGGDGRTTFGIPDLRGRVPMHVGHGPGLSDRQLGARSGTETNTSTAVQMPAHTHTVTPLGSTNDAPSVSPEGKVPAAMASTTLYTDPDNLAPQASATTASAGGNQPVNNMQPYLTFTCVMAIEGVYPSR